MVSAPEYLKNVVFQLILVKSNYISRIFYQETDTFGLRSVLDVSKEKFLIND